jgi:hypothetical protein
MRLMITDTKTELRRFKEDLHTNELYYYLAPGLGRL